MRCPSSRAVAEAAKERLPEHSSWHFSSSVAAAISASFGVPSATVAVKKESGEAGAAVPWQETLPRPLGDV